MADERTFVTLDGIGGSWGEPAPERKRASMMTLSDLVGVTGASGGPSDDADSVNTYVELDDEPTEAIELGFDEIPDRIGIAAAPGRYERMELLGVGGMGQVYRVRDAQLNRTVALKVLRPELLRSKKAMRLFEEEAQVASQLQHPGIIPIHDMGRLPDGRVWFTMKEVHGQTLEDLLVDHHRRATWDPVVLRRLVDGVQRVCDTVAFAHVRGVIHRDIKPANVMVGAFGEVLVLDWGLAKVLGEERLPTSPTSAFDRVTTTRSLSGSKQTRQGSVSGTPAYMPPEQARGQVHKLGPPADVYALGAMLYDLLVGHPPYEADTVSGMLDQVVAAEPIVPPVAAAPFPVDEALDAIVMKALAARPADRYETAAGMAEALRDWLDGAQKRERAMALVEEARARKEEADQLESKAKWLAQDAKASMDAVDPLAEESAKWAGWALDEQAQAAFAEAGQAKAEATQLLRSALSHAPDLPEAHDDLADVFHAEHRRLEKEGLTAEARDVEVQLRAHDRGRYAAYLMGTGAVTLVTDPPGAEVALYRYEMVRRRLQPVFVKDLGVTPLRKVPLPMGSYLLKIRAPGFQEVLYPVFIERQQHWDGVPPDGVEPLPIWLPKEGLLDKDDVYVPAGWFLAGHRTHPSALPWGWRWADGFLIRRFPMTYGEYAKLLSWSLVARGPESIEPLVFAFELKDAEGNRVRQFEVADGRVVQRPDGDGSLPAAPTPVYCVDYDRAVRVSEAFGIARGGPGWSLPEDLVWEKAARGVDGRSFPWGEHLDATWAWNFHSFIVPEMQRVGAFSADVSPYGIRDVSGGITDWAHAAIGRPATRGGAWNRKDDACATFFRWIPPAGAGANASNGARFSIRLEVFLHSH